MQSKMRSEKKHDSEKEANGKKLKLNEKNACIKNNKKKVKK